MGTCCSSGRAHSEGQPVYFYCPPVSEERQPLTFAHGTIAAISAGVLVDTNLDTSSPDTYRAPPPPLPYDVLVETVHEDGLASSESQKESDGKGKLNSALDPSDVTDIDAKSGKSTCLTIEEEDTCPICLEEYDPENPRITTECEHHFHLSCILEWMERSDTCPICDQVMVSIGGHSNALEEEFSFPQLQ